MKHREYTRREWLAASGALAAGVGGFGTSSCLAARDTPVTRKDLATLDEKSYDIVALGDAYKEMKKLPKTHVHNWIFQANIHGIPQNTDIPDNAKDVWETCQHGNWWFFPWHRAYVYYFEKIVRKYSGKEKFALPYWSWDSGAESMRKLHAAFLPGKPLFYKNRDNGNDGEEFLDQTTIDKGKSRAMKEQQFEGLQGRKGFGGPRKEKPVHLTRPHGLLEEAPHDYVHNQVGGDMGDPDLAARDPIFWVHHANIDRIWVEWLQQKGPFQNPTDTLWNDQTFTFYNEDEKEETHPVNYFLDITTLGYVYDTFKMPKRGATKVVRRGAMPAKVQTLAEMERKPHELGKEALPVTLSLPEKARRVLEEIIKPRERTAEPYLQLTIAGVRFSERPDSTIEVYINLPEKTAPNPKDPHYAGNFSFFDHPHEGTYSSEIEITDIVKALSSRPGWSSEALTITLVRVAGRRKREFRSKLTFDRLMLVGAR